VIFASEDVGLADSRALQIAIAAQQSVHFVGMPEGFFPLAHATLYLATAPKSRTVGEAYGAALADVESTRNDPVPLHLRNAPTRLMKHLGYGSGGGPNLPEALHDRVYFDPGTEGEEARLRAAFEARRGASPQDPFPE
jgi:putative ATPase